jgi:hypothetical protein
MTGEHIYGEAVDDFAIGDRVGYHPATDLFARGQRFATVLSIAGDPGRVYTLPDVGSPVYIEPELIRVVRKVGER